MNVFVDEDGNFSGSILDSIDDYLNNPSGADITYTLPSKSSAINSATLADTTNDLSVSITGVVGNSLNNTVTVRAEGEIDGTDRTVDKKINIDLVYSTTSDAEAGATGTTGATGPAGISGESGIDSTVAGPTGPAGADSTVSGPTGPAGADSTVAGPTGPAGADSTVPGPQGGTGPSGPSGEQGTQGQQGNAGTVGETGEQGTQGQQGNAGTVGETGEQGQQGKQGNDGDDSTVAGPQGDQGDTGNQGEQGQSGDAAALDFSTLASYFEEDTDAPAGSVTFNFNTQQILIGSSGADS